MSRGDSSQALFWMRLNRWGFRSRSEVLLSAPFHDLPRAPFIEKIELDPPVAGLSFVLKSFSMAKGTDLTEPVEQPGVYAYKLQKMWVNSRSSSFYDPLSGELYLQRMKHPDENVFDYTSGCFLYHNATHALLALPKERETIKEGIFFAGTGTFNHYHLVVEILSKAAYLDSLSDGAANLPLLVDDIVINMPGAKALLEFVAAERKIIFLSKEKTYQVESLWVISNSVDAPFNIRPGYACKVSYCLTRASAVEYLRSRVMARLAQIKPDLEVKPRIFISRKQNLLRTYNHDEVLSLLKKYQFEELFLEDYSIWEQAYLIQNADFIVGPTGAAWTNLIFARKGARGLCWLAEQWGKASAFPNLAGIVGFNLNYLFFSTQGIPHSAPYHLNVHSLEQHVKRLLQL